MNLLARGDFGAGAIGRSQQKLAGPPVRLAPQQIAGAALKTQWQQKNGKKNSDLVAPNPPKRITNYKITAGLGSLLYVLISLPKRDKTVVVAVRVEVVANDDFVIVDVRGHGGRGTRKINP